MKLTEKSNEVFEYVKKNGEVGIPELEKAIGRPARSINANVLDLRKKGLAETVKKTVDGQDKPVTYVFLTDDGKNFVPTEE